MSTRHVSKSRDQVVSTAPPTTTTTPTPTTQNTENGIVLDSTTEMSSAEKKKKRRSRWGRATVHNDEFEANTNGGLDNGGKKERHDGVYRTHKKEAGNNNGVHDELSRTLPPTHWSPSPHLLAQIVHKLHDPSTVKSVEISRQYDDNDTSHVNRKYDAGEIENGCNYPNTAIRLGPQSASSLSRIPWKYHPSSHMISGTALASTTTSYDGRHGEEKAKEETKLITNQATQQQQQQQQQNHPNGVLLLPTYSYLDLRTHQNLQYATQRLHEGIQFAQSNHLTKAEACYKQGLEVAPNHVELLVAYGALCANRDQLDKAKDLLQGALDLDPQCPNGKTYLDIVQNKMGEGSMMKQKEEEEEEVQQRRKQDSEVHEQLATSEMGDTVSKTVSTNKKKKEEEKWKGGVISRTENAMRDALTERAFLMSGFGAGRGGVDVRYPMLTEDDDDDLEPPLENHDAVGEGRGDEKESGSSPDGRHGRKMRGDKKRSTKHHDDRDDEHRRQRRKKRSRYKDDKKDRPHRRHRHSRRGRKSSISSSGRDRRRSRSNRHGHSSRGRSRRHKSGRKRDDRSRSPSTYSSSSEHHKHGRKRSRSRRKSHRNDASSMDSSELSSSSLSSVGDAGSSVLELSRAKRSESYSPADRHRRRVVQKKRKKTRKGHASSPTLSRSSDQSNQGEVKALDNNTDKHA